MKFNEKKVEEILRDILKNITDSYNYTGSTSANSAKSKLEALLKLIDFE